MHGLAILLDAPFTRLSLIFRFGVATLRVIRGRKNLGTLRVAFGLALRIACALGRVTFVRVME